MEHNHEWGVWTKQLWYTSGERLTGEVRKCCACPAAEARNLQSDTRPAVLQPTVGVFAGIFNEEGKLLLKKITSGKFTGEWDLPGGGVDAIKASQALDERIICEELVREVWEEVGLWVDIEIMAPMFPVVLKGGSDWAFLIHAAHVASPSKGEIKWVSLDELEELAKGPEGGRLLSGYGKRMHRLCLIAFITSLPPIYSAQARDILDKIQVSWQ